MLGLKLNHVSKGGHRNLHNNFNHPNNQMYIDLLNNN